MKVRLDAGLPKETREAVKAAAMKAVFEQHDALNNDFDAIVLWVLRESEGYGYARLRRFYENFRKYYEDLREKYMMGNDTAFVCRTKLFEAGVDIASWNAEITGRNSHEEKDVDAS